MSEDISALFIYLDEKQLRRLESISTKKSFSAGEILFYEGEEPTKFHALLKGTLRLYKTNAKGGEIVIHDSVGPCFVAEIANFENRPFPATARCLTDAVVMKIDFAAFKEEFLKNPEVSYAVIRSLLHKLRVLEGLLTRELTLPAEAKVANMLLNEAKVFETTRHNEIARGLNMTPETLSRTLARFRQSGWIDFDKKSMKVLDDDALKILLG